MPQGWARRPGRRRGVRHRGGDRLQRRPVRPFAAFNVGAIKAAQILFDEVNAKGGIHGRKIRFVVEDHAYQVPKAVQNFNKLINSDQVFAMILNLGTPHNIAGFPQMTAKQVANVGPLTAARQMVEGDITYKYAGFSSYYDQMRAGVQYLAKEKGAKNFCVMYLPTDFGQEVYEGVKDEVATMGLTFAAETTHKPDEQDFVGTISKLRDAKCDVVGTAVTCARRSRPNPPPRSSLDGRLLHRVFGRLQHRRRQGAGRRDQRLLCLGRLGRP